MNFKGKTYREINHDYYLIVLFLIKKYLYNLQTLWLHLIIQRTVNEWFTKWLNNVNTNILYIIISLYKSYYRIPFKIVGKSTKSKSNFMTLSEE